MVGNISGRGQILEVALMIPAGDMEGKIFHSASQLSNMPSSIFWPFHLEWPLLSFPSGKVLLNMLCPILLARDVTLKNFFSSSTLHLYSKE